MSSVRLAAGLTLFSILTLPALAWSYAPQAEADFQSGRSFQAAHQWGPAVRAYLAAYREDPSLHRALKDLGSVYYLAGSPKGAVYYYDRYLALEPGDQKARDFDDRLRASLGMPPLEAAAPARPPEGGFRPGFDVRVPLTFMAAGASDVDDFYAENPSENGGGFTITDNQPGAALGFAAGVGADYGLSDGFVAGLDLLYGPLRSYSVSNSATYDGVPDGTEADNYDIHALSAFLTPGWRFRLARNLVLEPRLGLGFMDTTVSLSSTYTFPGEPSFSENAASSGSGFALWPELRAEYLFGQFGVGASLGYLYGLPEAQKYTSVPQNSGLSVGSPVQYTNAGDSPVNWSSVTEGLTFGLYAVYHFQPLFW